MLVTKVSDYSGLEHTMDIPVTQEQLSKWESGTFIQNAMPNLSADQREFLMTGVTAQEWDKMFPEEDEPEDDGGLLSWPAF
jgi:hypothetical protein